ncbi:MAG: hypothetical protein LBH25_15180, partial [Fibromonadaceae bacterium]|nr:hypothetical protein [Fibromonadaceae bacterium]
MKKAASLLALFCIVACNLQENTFTDTRDGKKYKTTKIGEQVWMAENLNYKTPEGSWGFGSSTYECNKCGRLYDYNTAMTACPSEWHLPSRQEWRDLVKVVGSNAGTKLKAKICWGDVGHRETTDNYGFSALNCGNRLASGGFGGGYFGYWWTATGDDSGKAYYQAMSGSGEREL